MIRFHWPMIDLGRAKREELDAALVAATERVQRLLPINWVDVAISVGAGAIPQWGVGGFTSGPARVTIFLDPANRHFSNAAVAQRLSATLAHELHHAARMRGPGYGKTLGEALVTEGLAQVFEQETGHPVAFYSTQISGASLGRMAERALPALDDPGYDHAAWFFGRAGDPLHGGYAIAHALAKNWLRMAGTTAAAAASIDAEQVLRPWRSGALRLGRALVAPSPIP